MFIPTDVGMIVNRFLTEHFTSYVDYKFTAHLEDELDEISRGERDWVPVLEEFWIPFKKRVDEGKDIKPPTWEERPIGTDPASGKPVIVRMGKYGPLAQIGHKDDPVKPRFASLRANQRIDTITLEQALDLFKLPRKLGELPNGEEVEVNIGRFGPYVRHGKSFVSLKKDDDPFTIELPRAIELIEQKAAALKAATIKEFPGSPIRIIKGRFGPYITDGERRANIPRARDPEVLSVLDCEFFLAEAALKEKPGKGGKGKGGAKKTAAKAAPAEAAEPKAQKAPAKKAVKKTAAKKTTKKKG
jgi:DNA topoisomerase-1